MSVEECITQYATLADQVFGRQRHHRINYFAMPWNWQAQGRFDGAILEACIKNLVQERGLDKDTLFKDDDEAICKV